MSITTALPHLDLCGIAGIGVFYLLMKRGLDVLLAHPKADPERTAMTGLSGGGWQTALLAALDERVKAIVPVAGHSAIWQRRGCIEDIGDQEQCPADLCTIADYDTLSALFAPRPTLLIYNRHDDCCFQTRRARKSIYEPIRPVFALLDARANIALYDNTDPGTHNYERDNRRQLYKFLNQHWGLETPDDDLPYRDELQTEEALAVGPAPRQRHFALHRAGSAWQDQKSQTKSTPSGHSTPDACLVTQAASMEESFPTRSRPPYKSAKTATIQHYLLHLDDTWTLPLTEYTPPRPRGIELLIADSGRSALAAPLATALAQGRRVLVADILATGELRTDPRHQMLVATAGQRPLGIQVGQVLALLATASQKSRTLHLTAHGRICPIVALIAAALKPQALASLNTNALIDSLGRLIDWPLSYNDAPSLYCFGLLAEFDIPDLIALSAPVPLADPHRGPLRR